MLVKNIIKYKNAISPILATLLLIVIAVAAVVVTYAWFMTYTSSTSGHAGVLLKKDAVNWQSGKIEIYIRNTGTSDATIVAVYIGESSSNQTSATFTPSGSSALVPRDGGTLQLTVNYNWAPQKTYYFRIVPKLGEALVFEEKAP